MLQMRCSHSYTLNKNVFSLCLNMSSPMSDVRSSTGRLFHERGPWMVKLQCSCRKRIDTFSELLLDTRNSDGTEAKPFRSESLKK